MELIAQHMGEAIAEARCALGLTHPNPAVGAVILHRGEIAARGHTQPAGDAHAEVMALRAFVAAGLEPDDSTALVVTMEPCSTTGRTGPCTTAIINSGIRKVVIGAIDPNPVHAGRGINLLKEAGIEVLSGIMEEECADINLIFNWQMKHQAPFIAAKVATTLDGRIASRGGLSKWITGPEARQDVHLLRRYYPAIAVGAGTVLADDPALTVRNGFAKESCPVRFVFDRSLITFRETPYKVYSDLWKKKTIVVTGEPQSEGVQKIQKETGLEFWMLPDGTEEESFSAFARRCHEAGITGVLLEGGAQLLSAFLKYRFIHYLYAYRAPKLMADSSALPAFTGQAPVTMKDAIRLEHVRHFSFGDDQLMRGYVVYPEKGTV